MAKNTILIISEDVGSTTSVVEALNAKGFQVSSLETSRLPPQTVEALEGGAQILVVSPKEISVRKLILHHLTNVSRSLLGPVSTVNDIIKGDRPGLHQDLKELTSLMKEAAEQLHKDLAGITGLEEIWGRETCNLLDAVRQAEKSYRASLADSDIQLTIKVDERVRVAAPEYLVSLALANTIDNARDAILEAGGRAGRDVRIESDVEACTVVCRVINSGAIDAGLVPHIFEKRYSTKKHGRGIGLQLVAECLVEYNAELTLTTPGPPETVFSFRLERAPHVESAGSP